MRSINDIQKEVEEELFGQRGEALIKKISEVIARQTHRIETQEVKINILTVFEENRDILLNMDEEVSYKQGDLSSSFIVRADSHLERAGGFHQIEFDKSGRPFRWCGEFGLIVFDCYLNRSKPLNVTLQLIGTVDEENLKKCELFDGAILLPVNIANRTDGSARIISAELAPRKESVGLTRMIFRFPQYRKLSDADARVAAVAFSKLTVDPKR